MVDALYAYSITAGPVGISPYHAVFRQKERLPCATEGHQCEGDRLQLVREAQEYLEEFRQNQRAAYHSKEPLRAKSYQSFVSVRVLNPRKWTANWQPGYQVCPIMMGE